LSNNVFHKTVLVEEVIENLNIESDALYIDATFGCGGHTEAILNSNDSCKVVGLDWDKESLDFHSEKLIEKFQDRLEVIWGNFAQIGLIAKKNKISDVDGILADFGTSQFQIKGEKGLSFSIDSPLDMRMSPAHQRTTAADVVNKFNERELANIFFKFGEEKFSRFIARAISDHRKNKAIKTTKQLADIVESVIPKKVAMTKKTHPATKVFQALRIFVNNELDNITSFIKGSIRLLKPGGRLLCISFHSLEDRLVKNIFKENMSTLKIITTKPILPSDDEVESNPSARSAKLRVAEKI